MDTKGESWESAMSWEIGIDLNGKEIQKRGVTDICMADSLCCTAEADTVV